MSLVAAFQQSQLPHQQRLGMRVFRFRPHRNLAGIAGYDSTDATHEGYDRR